MTLHFTGEIDQTDNLGRTVQLDFEPGSTIEFDGRTFEFKQLHFHTPSEHLIDGVTYPMEMHLVNILKDVPEGETPEYLVIAFLSKMGGENRFIASFIDRVPERPNHSAQVELNAFADGGLFIEDLAESMNHYYFYRGSLTTPPYTESVIWHVLKDIFEASPEQILRINELEGDNARHIQAPHHRPVEQQ